MFLLFSICISAFGQSDQQDTVILLNAFRAFYRSGQIVYVDTVENCGFATERLKQAIKKGKLTAIGKTRKDNFIKLNRSERKYLLEQIKIKTIWDDNLFCDSKRICVDSLWTYLKKEKTKYYEELNRSTLKKDSLTYNKLKYKYPYVFSFKKPIFLKDKTICLISFTALCGNDCGRAEISFYKIQNNEWKKWFVFAAGAF